MMVVGRAKYTGARNFEERLLVTCLLAGGRRFSRARVYSAGFTKIGDYLQCNEPFYLRYSVVVCIQFLRNSAVVWPLKQKIMCGRGPSKLQHLWRLQGFIPRPSNFKEEWIVWRLKILVQWAYFFFQELIYKWLTFVFLLKWQRKFKTCVSKPQTTEQCCSVVLFNFLFSFVFWHCQN